VDAEKRRQFTREHLGALDYILRGETTTRFVTVRKNLTDTQRHDMLRWREILVPDATAYVVWPMSTSGDSEWGWAWQEILSGPRRGDSSQSVASVKETPARLKSAAVATIPAEVSEKASPPPLAPSQPERPSVLTSRVDTCCNGWLNFETSCVYSLVEQDRDFVAECRELARESRQPAPNGDLGNGDTESEADAPRYLLADRLKRFVDELNPLADDPSHFADLLDAALVNVDWMEIADAILADVGEPGASEGGSRISHPTRSTLQCLTPHPLP
jgi:hypothetical protein